MVGKVSQGKNWAGRGDGPGDSWVKGLSRGRVVVDLGSEGGRELGG